MSEQLQMQQWLWAHRLTLANFTRDADMIDLVSNEVGDCVACWRLIAQYCAQLASLLTERADYDARVDMLLGAIAFALDTSDDEILTLSDPDEEDDAA